MSAPDWLLPARSIPVWVGAVLVHSADGSPGGVCARINGGTTCTVRSDGGHVSRTPTYTFTPDLSNPDTFAAARDRLAVAMGGSAERVREGTMFQVDGGRWVLYAGMGTYRLDMDEFDIPIDASRELALALAWQKVVGA